MSDELIQKAYWEMTDAEKRKESQEFFQKLEARYDEFNKTGMLFYSKIDDVLREKRPFEELSEIIRSEDCSHTCIVENSFVNLRFLYGIAQKEYTSGIEMTLYHVSSIHEAELVLQQLHFYLRRIEFNWDETECEEILDFIKERHISYVCLAEAICRTKYNRPAYISTMLAGMMERAGMRREAMKLLYLAEAYLIEEKGKA